MTTSSRIVSAAMRHAARIAAFTVAATSLLALSACGSQSISLAENDPNYKGAKIFEQRCSGCHTLSVAGTQGSAVNSHDKEPTDGPNFDQRKETEANVLYALRNGGFSGKYMPANLATGEDAKAVARFLAKYAGSDAQNPPAPRRVEADDDPGSADTTTGVGSDGEGDQAIGDPAGQ